MRFDRRQIEMLLDAPHPRFEFAYDQAMANDRAMVLYAL
jgi:hypothetical protein